MNRAVYCLAVLGFVGLLNDWAKAQDNQTQSSTVVAAKKPSGQTRQVAQPDALRRWLESMVWHHGFQREEILQVTGLQPEALDQALKQFNITATNKPLPEVDPPIFVLPYPGGRHPRIGFLDGAIEPQRETKLSIFAPWDRTSYVVLDVPEAIWSNLGLTYLAHTHIDTVWTKQGIQLEQLEWQLREDGSYYVQRVLPNKISFTVTATPHRGHLAIDMSLTNGTEAMLSDLRVQMCAMLRGLKGFDAQTNDNKIFRGPFAACRNASSDQWVIMAFEPKDRTWGNPPCPCLHSDPKFPDCQPGETQHVHGWLSFYQGKDIDAELARISKLWQPLSERTISVQVVDEASKVPIAARVYVRSEAGQWYFAEAGGPESRVMRYEKQNWINANSQEFHTCVSAHPFRLRLPPGKYTLTVERGKEYSTASHELTVDESSDEKAMELPLKRWINMAEKGWYSGDTHVHRPVSQIAVPMLADDVNVALPMTYWTTRSNRSAADGDRTDRGDAALPARLIEVDQSHVIWPKNTEWEIFSVEGKNHTLGALFALNHRTAFPVSIPPIKPIIDQVDKENALLDMDKHDWPFAMVLPAMLGNRVLFELANNHNWRTEFAFTKWTTPAAAWMNPKNAQTVSDNDGVPGGGEREWLEYMHHTYWCLLNAGYKLAPTAGTATGVHPVPMGYGRVYVNVPGPFHYGQWIEGLRAGRSFVTTGPMLLVERTGNRVQAQVLTDGTIEEVQWIVNGEIRKQPLLAASPTSGARVEFKLEKEFNFDETSWVAVRVWQRTSDGRLQFAHSAPQWFEVAGKPIRPTEAQQQFLIRRMEQELQRSQSLLLPNARAEYEEALKLYRGLNSR